MRDFEGKIAIVTGAASGIGRALSEELARRGAVVLVTDRDGPGAESVAQGIVAGGGRAEPATLDVTSAEAVSALVARTVAAHGRLDLMVNNAGMGTAGLVEELTLPMWKRAIDVNLYGVIHGVHAAYPVMVKQGSGHIVNVASLAGLLPNPAFLPYATTKFAVVGLSVSLRAEAKRNGVNVTAVCPGYVKSSIFENADCVDLDGKSMARKLRSLTIPVERAVSLILRGILRNDAHIVFPFYARLFWLLYRLHPALLVPIQKRSMADFFAVRARSVAAAVPAGTVRGEGAEGVGRE